MTRNKINTSNTYGVNGQDEPIAPMSPGQLSPDDDQVS